jgi:hypothetical protein
MKTKIKVDDIVYVDGYGNCKVLNIYYSEAKQDHVFQVEDNDGYSLFIHEVEINSNENTN